MAETITSTEVVLPYISDYNTTLNNIFSNVASTDTYFQDTLQTLTDANVSPETYASVTSLYTNNPNALPLQAVQTQFNHALMSKQALLDDEAMTSDMFSTSAEKDYSSVLDNSIQSLGGQVVNTMAYRRMYDTLVNDAVKSSTK